MREHSLAKEPVLLIVGRREPDERRVSIRRLGSQALTGLRLDEALTLLADEATAPDVKRAQGGAGEVRVAAE